jgi:NAD(P)H-hydrate epimerase
VHARDADWLVDAMLGTGARGEPRPPFDAAIDWMNAQSCKKLAVDVPSGLDCDSGQPAVHAVRADHTCTFAAMKAGFLQPAARPFTGTIHVCDIGVPPQLIDLASK